MKENQLVIKIQLDYFTIERRTLHKNEQNQRRESVLLNTALKLLEYFYIVGEFISSLTS